MSQLPPEPNLDENSDTPASLDAMDQARRWRLARACLGNRLNSQPVATPPHWFLSAPMPCGDVAA